MHAPHMDVHVMFHADIGMHASALSHLACLCHRGWHCRSWTQGRRRSRQRAARAQGSSRPWFWQNFDRFISCNTTNDDVHSRLRVVERACAKESADPGRAPGMGPAGGSAGDSTGDVVTTVAAVGACPHSRPPRCMGLMHAEATHALEDTSATQAGMYWKAWITKSTGVPCSCQ